MAQQLRFSALTIFLILLGVILIGFLLHRTWESFVNNKEGFSANYGTETGIASTDLNGKYSTDNSTTAKLVTSLYFDPTNKAMINISGDVIYIKKKDGTDLSYNTTTAAPNLVTDLNTGEIIASTPTDLSYVNVAGSSLSALTVGAAKTYFGTLTETKYIYMDISFGASTNGASDDTVIGASSVRTFFANVTSPPQLASSSALYPALSTNTNPFRKYKRTLATSGMSVASAATTANPVAYGWRSPTGLGVISVPLFLNSGITPTNTTFIHIMDMNSKKHLAAYYFQGSAVEKYSFADANIAATGKTVGIDTTPTSSTPPSFTGNIAGMTYDFSNTSMKVSARHDTSLNMIFIANRVGDNMFRAYIKIDSSLNPVVVKSETGYETGSTTGSSNYGDNTSTDVTGWSNTSSSSSSGGDDTFSEITKALNLIKSMQSIFGSQDSNYLLKTEVVPPVCPTCPSCSSSSGVCTNCGGNGGCGTQTAKSDASGNSSSAGSIVKSGVGGVTDIGRDAVAGTTDLGKTAMQGVSDVASGTGNFLKDSGSGIGQFAKDSASGVFGATKEIGSGLFGATKEIGSSAYGATKDLVGGSVGIGREIANGVGGMFHGDRGGGGGYDNSYGGPQYGQGSSQNGQGSSQYGQGSSQYGQGGYNQGGYLRPTQSTTPGQDPYSYYGTLPPRSGGANFMPLTADFSSFGK